MPDTLSTTQTPKAHRLGEVIWEFIVGLRGEAAAHEYADLLLEAVPPSNTARRKLQDQALTTIARRLSKGEQP